MSASAYDALDSLRTVLRSRRGEILERLARGLTETTYHQHVGRAKELEDVVELVTSQIKSLGEDDGTDD